MTIDPNRIRWASGDETDPVSGRPNKTPVSEEFKTSGAKRMQPVSRQFINNQFNEIYNAAVDLQAQIDAITGGSTVPVIGQIYPIGSVYFSSVSTNPATVFGIGTWEAIEGKFIVGVEAADPDFGTVLQTGGAKTHFHTDTISVDDHTLTEAEIPSHNHDTTLETATAGSGVGGTVNLKASGDGTGTEDFTSDSTGGGTGHNHSTSGGIQSESNLVPYQALYIFRRTA